MYNLTNLTQGNTLLDLVTNVNDLGGGSFMLLVLLLIFVVMFVTFRRNGNLEGMLTSSYLTSVIAIFMFWGGFISIMILLIPIILTAVFGLVKINS